MSETCEKCEAQAVFFGRVEQWNKWSFLCSECAEDVERKQKISVFRELLDSSLETRLEDCFGDVEKVSYDTE